MVIQAIHHVTTRLSHCLSTSYQLGATLLHLAEEEEARDALAAPAVAPAAVVVVQAYPLG